MKKGKVIAREAQALAVGGWGWGPCQILKFGETRASESSFGEGDEAPWMWPGLVIVAQQLAE